MEESYNENKTGVSKSEISVLTSVRTDEVKME